MIILTAEKYSIVVLPFKARNQFQPVNPAIMTPRIASRMMMHLLYKGPVGRGPWKPDISISMSMSMYRVEWVRPKRAPGKIMK